MSNPIEQARNLIAALGAISATPASVETAAFPHAAMARIAIPHAALAGTRAPEVR